MRVLDLREMISRITFRIMNIRYKASRHYMAAVFMLLFIILIAFTAVFIGQRKALERKENIIKSFYGDNENGEARNGLMTDAAVIQVYVCGMVKNPGVYEAKEGCRVAELIEAAGGATGKASLDALNLAQEVFDGQRIYIPSIEESAGGDSSDSGIVNINTASSSRLESLPGIGPVTAEKIIRYREENGAFKTKEALMGVSGIGIKKFSQIKDLIGI